MKEAEDAETQREINREDKIRIAAAQFNSQYAIPNLCQLIGQRQIVANYLIRAKMENIKDLEAQLEYINLQIKQLLGV